MNNNLRKKIEIVFFIFLNLIFSCWKNFSIITWPVSNLITFYYSYVGQKDSDYLYFLSTVIFILVYIASKLFLFPILYSFKKLFPFMHDFFEKFGTKHLFRNKVLLSAICLDIFVFLVENILFTTNNYKEEFILWLLSGGGVLTSYLILLVFLKIVNFFRKKFTKCH